MDDTPIPSTKRGTPYAKSWSPAWAGKVALREDELDRRICGAIAYDEEPCEMAPASENGRCRFHGGAPNVGAPKDNFNARVHGLYSHRLQACGDHCPFWDRCPHAKPEILDLPLAKRPVCAIEAEEFDLLSRQFMVTYAHTHQTYALLGTLVGRAARAMTLEPIQGENGKPSKALAAFIRLLREHQSYGRQSRFDPSLDERWRRPMFPKPEVHDEA